jgi:hypothetical protein
MKDSYQCTGPLFKYSNIFKCLPSVGEGLEGASNAWQEPAIKINQAKEALELLNILWHRQLEQGVHMFAQRGDDVGCESSKN